MAKIGTLSGIPGNIAQHESYTAAQGKLILMREPTGSLQSLFAGATKALVKKVFVVVNFGLKSIFVFDESEGPLMANVLGTSALNLNTPGAPFQVMPDDASIASPKWDILSQVTGLSILDAIGAAPAEQPPIGDELSKALRPAQWSGSLQSLVGIIESALESGTPDVPTDGTLLVSQSGNAAILKVGGSADVNSANLQAAIGAEKFIGEWHVTMLPGRSGPLGAFAI